MSERGRAVSWAERVTDAHRHGLADLENVLLINDRRNVQRLQHRPKGRFAVPVLYDLLLCVAASPLAAPVVFTSGSFRGTKREFEATWAYPTAAVVCWIGIVVLGVYFVRWRAQRVRLRDKLGATFAVLYVLGTTFALYASYSLADSLDGSLVWYVVPMWILLALSLLSVLYQFSSPTNPAWNHSTGTNRRIDVGRLHEEDQAWLLDERDQALRILDRRGLLEGGTPDSLAARPLGELHLPQEGTHDQQQ